MDRQVGWEVRVGKLNDRIATRAYLMGVDGKPGTPEQHWVTAEQIEWMDWLVESRSATQVATYELFSIIKEYRHVIIANPRLGHVVDALTGAAFGLWRAVFLGRAQSGLKNMVDHATDFLENLINTNAVMFNNEARTGNWTFRFYTDSAALRLKSISQLPFEPQILAYYNTFVGDATEWWDLNQERFELAITGFRAETIRLHHAREWNRSS